MDAQKLINEIDRKVRNWNERSMFNIKGVKNLSMADLGIIKLYAETHQRQGNFSGLMSPLGQVKEVLKKYNLV